MMIFAEAGSRDPCLHRQPHSPSSPVEPGSPRSQLWTSWHRHSPHFLANAIRKLPLSEAGNYPGSILDHQQHILGVCGGGCQFVAIGTCPASIYGAFRPCHLGWHLPNEGSLCRHQAVSSSTPAARGPLVLPLLQSCPSADSHAGRAAEGGVRAGCLALGHAPSLEEPGASGRAGGNEQKHKQRVTSS